MYITTPIPEIEKQVIDTRDSDTKPLIAINEWPTIGYLCKLFLVEKNIPSPATQSI